MADVFFPDYVIEQLGAFGSVSARPMFGGNGLYKAGVMFAIIFDGELSFTVGDSNRADFEAKKSEPFVYVARGRPITLSYWFVPEDVVEDTEQLAAWAAKAYAAAIKNAKTTPLNRKPAAAALRRSRGTGADQ